MAHVDAVMELDGAEAGLAALEVHVGEVFDEARAGRFPA